MSNVVHILPPRIRAAATVIAVATDGDSGSVDGLLDRLPAKMFAHVVDVARRALSEAEAAGHADAAERRGGQLAHSYVDALRLDLDAGSLLILMRDRASRPSGAFSAAGATQILGADTAATLWAAVAACVRSEAQAAAGQTAAAPASPSPEPAP